MRLLVPILLLTLSLCEAQTMSEQDLLKLIPEQSGLYFVGCVNCDAGQQEGQLSVWSPAEPDVVKCEFCGHAYPSDKYPTSGVTEVKTPSGGTARYPYYECSPAWWKEKEPYRAYFAARVDYHKIRYMENQALDLAKAYQDKQDAEAGHRAALILKRFAEVYPGYCYHFDFPFRQKQLYDGNVAPQDFRGGFRTARWTWWAYLDVSTKLLEVYEILSPAGELKKIGAEDSVRAMLMAMAEQVISNEDDLTNMSPGMWAALVRAGRVLGKPEYVHTALGRTRRMVTELFFYDGTWQEGAPSYHSQTVGGLTQVFNAAKGYSDPAGYKHPETGERFDDLDVATTMPEVVRAREALLKMRLPNGRLAPVHDTWWSDKRGEVAKSSPVLLGGLGHGLLGHGEGESQLQAHLTWSPGYGHRHFDGLSLLLFAQGKELLSDLGYTHTKWREWAVHSASHNLVVVDQTAQTADKTTYGDLRAFSADGPVQIVSVDNPQVYPGVTTTYRRTVALVPLDEANSYLVDVFTVKGGKTHDYFLHGSADDAQTLTAPGQQFGPLPSLLPPGAQFTGATSESDSRNFATPGLMYGYLANLRQARPAAGLAQLEYRTEGSPAGLTVYTVTREGDELITGTNPSIRQAGSDDSKLDQYQRQFAMLRRQGGESVFISVLIPHGEQQPVQSVKLVDLPGAATALEVTTGDRRDLILIESEGARGTTGELVIITPQATTTLGAPPPPARLLGVERKPEGSTLLVEGLTPAAGSTIAVDHGGKRTSAYTVKSATNGRLVLDGEAGFDYDATTQTSKFNYLPRESYTGPHTVSATPVKETANSETAK